MDVAPVLFGLLGGLGPGELVLMGIIAVLLFGKRLPEVAKSLGSSYQQFRRGLADIQKQVDVSGYVNDAVNSVKYGTPSSNSSSSASSTNDDFDDYDQPTAPKFEPPPAEEPTDAKASS